MMTSHKLAKKLLSFPDQELVSFQSGEDSRDNPCYMFVSDARVVKTSDCLDDALLDAVNCKKMILLETEGIN